MSLVELLVVITLVTLMLATAAFTVRSAMNRAATAQEMQAGRSLIQAYLTTAVDYDGELLPAYDRTVHEILSDDGALLSGPTVWRYPWRLLPYLDHRLEGTMLLRSNRSEVSDTNAYAVSAYPALGINHLFVGGNLQPDGSREFADHCVTRISQASQPSSLLVFASARADGFGNRSIGGFNQLTPPQTTTAMWNAERYTESAPAAHHGHLHPRHDGRVVTVFLGGNAALHTVDELRDMRFWSNQARLEDDPNYRIPRPPPASRR